MSITENHIGYLYSSTEELYRFIVIFYLESKNIYYCEDRISRKPTDLPLINVPLFSFFDICGERNNNKITWTINQTIPDKILKIKNNKDFISNFNLVILRSSFFRKESNYTNCTDIMDDYILNHRSNIINQLLN